MQNESLEVILRKIDESGKNLFAEIIHRKEDGYWRGGSEWIVTASKISEPDNKKRAKAKKELTEIFDFSPWYSARYKAGSYLMELDNYSFADKLDTKNKLAIMFAREFKINIHIRKDSEDIERLKKDFNALYNLLPTTYIREKVCEVMGYSKLKFLAMEYPLATKSAGVIAAVGIVSTLLYGLVEYLGG